MDTKKALTRDDLLSASPPQEFVDLPELGGGVWVKGLTGEERDAYEGEVMQRDRKTGQLVPNLSNARAKLIAMSLVNEDGSYVFDVNKGSEVRLLAQVPARSLQHIWDKACELSGLSESDVEEYERDFDGAQRNGSSSDSPGTSDSPPLRSLSESPPVS